MITERAKLNFTGKLNKCSDVISPRFAVQLKDLEKWQNILLLPHQFGFIVLTAQLALWSTKKQHIKTHRGNKQTNKKHGEFFF